jgi:hypothetical protein
MPFNKLVRFLFWLIVLFMRETFRLRDPRAEGAQPDAA